MEKKFSNFESTSVSGTDEAVGWRPGDPNTTANKRWTFNAILGWVQGLIDITRLNRTQANHFEVTGTGTGGTPSIRAFGTDANISISLVPKGTGTLIFGSDMDTDGNDLDTDGGAITTGGGVLNTEGGNISTGNGAVNAGSGNVSTTGAVSTGTLSVGTSANIVNLTATGTSTFTGVITAGGATVTLGATTVGALTGTSAAFSGNVSVAGALDADTIGASSLSQLTVIAGATFQGLVKIGNELNLPRTALTAGAISTVVPQGVFNEVVTVTTVGDGISLPLDPVITFGSLQTAGGRTLVVRNSGNKNLNVWSLGTTWRFDNGVLNTPFVLAPGEGAMFISKPQGSPTAPVVYEWASMRFSASGGQTLSYRTVAADASFVDSDYTIDATAGTNFALPTATVRTGKVFILKNSSGVSINLNADGAELIDGAGTQAVAAANAIKVQSTGTGWIII